MILLKKGIKEVNKTNRFSRQFLYRIIQKQNPNYKIARFNWEISSLLRDGEIIRVGRNAYSLNSGCHKPAYFYHRSKFLDQLIKEIDVKFPLVSFIGWESFQLNEFLNHQLASNILFIEAEKMTTDAIFDFLNSQYKGKILLKPSANAFRLYATNQTIVLSNLISETPLKKTSPHDVLLEKLLVDIFAFKLIQQMINKAELPELMKIVFQRYSIDTTKMFRYARRRNVQNRMIKLMQENDIISNDCENYVE